MFGSKPGVAETAAERLTAKYNGLKIAGTCDGYFSDNDVPEIIEKINKIEIELDSQKQKVRMKENAEEILEKIQKTIDNILNIKKFSKNVCKEFVDKIVIYNDKKFDFYLKGYDTSFNFNEESNISYLPH